MAGKRRLSRPRRWRLRLFSFLGTGAVTLGAMALTGHDHQEVVSRSAPATPELAAVAPARVAKPRHLDATYVAPSTPLARPLGRLQIARLGIDARVVPVGWDGETMAVPNDPATLGWFAPSARLQDLLGTSLIAGHVSDARDHPGPLASLPDARVGDVITWRAGDHAIAFHVVAIQHFPRAAGLPTSLFEVTGPHMLRLVTCAHRVVSRSGFHYTDNLVVSAVAD